MARKPTNLKVQPPKLLKPIVTALVILFILTLVAQAVIDKNHMFSKQAFILNSVLTITLVSYFLTRQPKFLWGLLILLILFVFFEYLHQKGLPLDPYENKIRNCYTWFNIVQRSKTMGDDLDLTEGKFDCNPHKDYHKAQMDQRNWLLDKLDVKRNTRLIEIGSGNCNLLHMAKERGAIVKGITLSHEQANLCKTQKHLDVDVINFWDLDERYFGKFDCVLFNGPVEHFVTQGESAKGLKDKKYAQMFNIVDKLIDPKSANRRVAITCIHYFGRPMSLSDYLQVYFYERSYGGALPIYPDGLTKNAPAFNVLLSEDHTMDYYITSRLWWDKLDKGNLEPAVLLRCALLYPLMFLYDPYFVHKILHQLFKSWTWQFDPPSYAGHLWLVLQKK